MNKLVVNASEIDSLKDKIGTFTFKRLTIKDMFTQSLKYNEYTGGKELEVYINNLAYATSTLEVALEKKPDWFILDELVDPSIIFVLYKRYDDWVNSFRKSVPANKKTEGETTLPDV